MSGIANGRLASAPATAAGAAAAWALPLGRDEAIARHARGWLLLGIGALLLSGVFSVLIVLARAPGVAERLPWTDFFHTAIVVHVDLAVMALAPFLGAGRPVMANYVPVLDHPLFLGGLGVFAAGVLLQLGRALFLAPPVGAPLGAEGALRFGVNTSIVAAAVSALAFAWSWALLPDFLAGKERYEQLFWGGGHVLQYVHTQLVLVAWLWLASAGGLRVPLTPRVVVLLFAWGLATVFLTPLIYLAYEFGSVPHLRAFTWMMAYGGSLAAGPIAVALAAGAWRAAPPPGPSWGSPTT